MADCSKPRASPLDLQPPDGGRAAQVTRADAHDCFGSIVDINTVGQLSQAPLTDSREMLPEPVGEDCPQP